MSNALADLGRSSIGPTFTKRMSGGETGLEIGETEWECMTSAVIS